MFVCVCVVCASMLCTNVDMAVMCCVLRSTINYSTDFMGLTLDVIYSYSHRKFGFQHFDDWPLLVDYNFITHKLSTCLLRWKIECENKNEKNGTEKILSKKQRKCKQMQARIKMIMFFSALAKIEKNKEKNKTKVASVQNNFRKIFSIE